MAKKECYGGAFDIDPYSYWVREDLVDLVGAIEDLDPPFVISGIWIKNDKFFEIQYSDKNGEYRFFSDDIKIDRKRADTPEKLCKVYAPKIKDRLSEEMARFFKQIESDIEWEK